MYNRYLPILIRNMYNRYLPILITLLSLLSLYAIRASDSDEPVLYYYGMEESERSLPECVARQACSALVQRYWRPPALVRLCRCGRRQKCDAPADTQRLLEINNRAHLQFCQSVTCWPECTYNDKPPLTVISHYDRLNPDDLEEFHHKNIQLIPPKITLKCRCPSPYYWKLNSTLGNNVKVYQCGSLPVCRTGEYCGNVNYDLNALYQSCLCPQHHMCVHNGGIAHTQITELLYSGLGWKAYCQRINNEYSYEEY